MEQAASLTRLRTSIRLDNAPYRPLREIKQAVDRGDLSASVAIAKEFAAENERPIPLDAAAELLRLAASNDDYDRWACHWLARWLTERHPSAEAAAEMAGLLAHRLLARAEVGVRAPASALVKPSPRSRRSPASQWRRGRLRTRQPNPQTCRDHHARANAGPCKTTASKDGRRITK